MNPFSSLAVVGSGTDALLAALTLKRAMPGLPVTLVRDSTVTPDGPGESTTPSVLHQLVHSAGLAGADIHNIARPVWTLGFKCLWGGRAPFLRAFDAGFSRPVQGLATTVGFLAAEKGLELSSGGAALMSAGKLFPKDGANAFTPLEHITGLNFKPEALNDLLLRACRAVGVGLREGRAASFTAEPATLQLEDGGSVTADLFLDATGPEARLSTLAGNTAWSAHDLPCNRAATVRRRRGSEPIRPFTTLETLDSGWRWRIEHDDSVILGSAWNSDFTSDDEACAALIAKAGDTSLTPQLTTWKTGHLTAPWTGRVVAIGEAAGFVEPLSSLRLLHLLRHIQWLARIMAETDGLAGERSRDLYNRIAAEAWEETRDFHALHYLHHPGASPFWQHARENVTLRGCAEFVRIYGSVGPSPTLENHLPAWPGIIGLDQWFAALLGLGVQFLHRPAIPAADLKVWDAQCEQRRHLARQAVAPELCIGAARRAATPEPRPSLP